MKCSRCKRTIKGFRPQAPGEATAGYYDVTQSPWTQFATAFANEKYVCDDCMWSDPVYLSIYGKVPK